MLGPVFDCGVPTFCIFQTRDHKALFNRRCLATELAAAAPFKWTPKSTAEGSFATEKR
jgi:hypothetical protein